MRQRESLFITGRVLAFAGIEHAVVEALHIPDRPKMSPTSCAGNGCYIQRTDTGVLGQPCDNFSQ